MPTETLGECDVCWALASAFCLYTCPDCCNCCLCYDRCYPHVPESYAGMTR